MKSRHGALAIVLVSILAVAASLASTEATSQTIAFVAVDPPWLANADYGMVEVASGERRWLRLRPVTAEDPSWSWTLAFTCDYIEVCVQSPGRTAAPRPS